MRKADDENLKSQKRSHKSTEASIEKEKFRIRQIFFPQI